MYLTHHWKCDMVTCMDPKEAKSIWAPGGTLMGQSACSGGGESDSSAHEMEAPGGDLCLGIRASSPGGAAFSGSNAVSSLGVVTPNGGSALCISDGVLPLEVGAKGSLSATFNILRLTRLSLSITEVRHSQSSCMALQSIPRGIQE